MSRDEVILKIYEDLGATKTGIEYLVRRDEEASKWRDRMESDVGELKACVQLNVHRLGEVEKVQTNPKAVAGLGAAGGTGVALAGLALWQLLPEPIQRAILGML
jgi:hypothetical protein